MKIPAIKRTVCVLLSALFIAGFCTNASAETTETTDEQLTVSYENRENVEKALLDFIEENKAKTPSVSISVFDDKNDICNIMYGYANIDDNIEADENTVYEWGSVSKLLVWTSAMQLYEQGKLDLNGDIAVYLPKGFLKNLAFDEPITMLDLMNHAAGFQETITPVESEDINDLVALDEALLSAAPAQVAPPGLTVSYSNWSAALGAYVVSCASGMDYADYVNQNIFDKLGMEHTYMRPDASDNEWAAEQRRKLHSYMLGFDDDSMTDMGECRRYINLYPAGSAGGTISDMAKFAKALLCDSKDCPLFEKPDTLDLMFTPSHTFGDGSPRICHGMFYALYGDGLYGHGGNTEACSSDLQLDRKNKTGYVMMINTQGDRVYTTGLPKLLYGEREIPTESGFEKVDFSGHYRFGRSIGGAGLFRIGSPIEDRFEITKHGDTYTGMNGVQQIVQISDTFLEFSLINNTKRYYGMKKDDNGNIVLLESYQAIDLMKISDVQYYTDFAMMILLFASLLICAVFFIVHAVRFRKFKNTPTAKFRQSELIAALMSLLFLVIFAAVILNYGAFIDIGKPAFAAAAITLCVLAFVEAVMLVRCRFFKGDEKPDKTILLNIETVCCALTIVGIVYWRLFQWWGF